MEQLYLVLARAAHSSQITALVERALQKIKSHYMVAA